jgi:hypothetical protein
MTMNRSPSGYGNSGDPRRRAEPSRGGAGLGDLRPSSPAQLALIGVGLWLAGALVPVLGFLAPVGIILLAVAGITFFLRPRTREMYWRGRRIELGEPTWGERVYRAIYRR